MALERPGIAARPTASAGRRVRLAACCGLLLVVLAGCGLWGPPAEIRYDTPDTQACLLRLAQTNQSVTTFKGIGQVSVVSHGRRQIYDRVAWAGAAPGRLRLAVRAPSGLPLLSLSCDAEWVTVLNHSQGRYHRAHIGDNSLSAYLPVALRCGDLYDLLRGRPPTVDYDAAAWLPAEAATPGAAAIALKRRLRGTVARLFVDPDRNCRLLGAEVLNVHGNPSYRARLEYGQDFDGFALPKRLSIESDQGRMEIQVDREFPNAPVADELFVIDPP
jgi:outer membrane biogenesis lipoprotein LolB